MHGFMDSPLLRALHGGAKVTSRAAYAGATALFIAVALVVPAARGDVAPRGKGDLLVARDYAGAMQVPASIPDLRDGAMPAAKPEPKVTVYRADTPQNFEIGLRLKPTSDALDSEVVLRLRDAGNYYVVRFNARDEKVTFTRVSGGETKEIASVDCRIAANAWHSVHIRAEENHFEVSLDGVWLFTAYDSQLRSGRLAVWTKPGNPMQFDTIAVTPIGPE
jgi:hypothetical protein